MRFILKFSVKTTWAAKTLYIKEANRLCKKHDDRIEFKTWNVFDASYVRALFNIYRIASMIENRLADICYRR